MGGARDKGSPVSPTNDCVSACHSNLKSQSPLCPEGPGRRLWLSERPSIPGRRPWCRAQREGAGQSQAPGPQTLTSERASGQ